MRSKTYMSKINLQRGKLTVENRKSREKKNGYMLRSIGKQSGESVDRACLQACASEDYSFYAIYM